MKIPASVSDYRTMARQRLPRQLFDYIDGGSYAEWTLAENTNAFERLTLRQRVLKDVSDIQFNKNILGQEFKLPIALAPVGLAGSFANRGEVQAVKVANDLGIPFCLSTVSICAMEEVADAATQPFWYQLYMLRDKQVTANLLKRAKAVGCETLILTVDLPFPGARYRDTRNGLSGKQNLTTKLKRIVDFVSHPRWLWDVAITGKPLVFGNLVQEVANAKSLDDIQGWISEQFDPTITWQDLKWVRDQWPGKLILKGIMDTDDAKLAVAHHVDAIIVSNHGGRQLDSVPATLNAIADIKAVAGDNCEVLVDSGIRSGLDVVKAMAMGADFTLIGRPWVYALAANGGEGLKHMLELMQDEMRIAMALTGHSRIADLGQHIFAANQLPQHEGQ